MNCQDKNRTTKKINNKDNNNDKLINLIKKDK